MSERLTDQQLQILWEQWQPAAVEIQTLRARVAKQEAALRNVRGALTIDAAWVFAEAGLFTEEEFYQAALRERRVDKPGG